MATHVVSDVESIAEQVLLQLVGKDLPKRPTEHPRVSLDDVYLYHMHG